MSSTAALHPPRPIEIELSIVMPCLNEQESLPRCLAKAREFLARSGIQGEIIVADNGSTDASPRIAQAAGATVIPITSRGYGAALAGGIAAARGRYVIMADSDDTYDFSRLDQFVSQLRDGADFVMGNRYAGGIARGAMPALHRYLGNPLITFIGRRFFGGDCRDFYCGLRGFRKESFDELNLRSPGMEFALEMLVKATMYGMDVREVPTTLSPDHRGRAPHLRRWRDGWRSLKFLLLFSPKWLFWYPGLLLLAAGLAGVTVLSLSLAGFATAALDFQWLLLSAASTVVGYQACTLAVCGKQAALRTDLHPPSPRVQRWIDFLSLEKALVVGVLLGLVGLAGVVATFGQSAAAGFGGDGLAADSPAPMWRLFVGSVTLLILGGQTICGRFFLSLVEMCADWDRR
jgi:glycosyltransferase involved in cell wall biosynthesis